MDGSADLFFSGVRIVFRATTPQENPEAITMIIPCMSTTCMQCKKPIKNESCFFCVSHPYFGCLHPKCSPHFDFYSLKWPHPQPACYYETEAKV